MNIYYYNQKTGQHVPSSNPEKSNLQSTVRILNLLYGEGSFLGVYITDNDVMQFYREKGGEFTIELLKLGCKTVEQATINLPVAECALEKAFGGADIKEGLQEFFVRWHKCEIS